MGEPEAAGPTPARVNDCIELDCMLTIVVAMIMLSSSGVKSEKWLHWW